MMDWWTTRDPREKLLLQLAAAMTIVVVGIQFVILPILRGHERESLGYANETRILSVTSSYLDAVETSVAVSGAGQAANEGDLRNQLTGVAQIRGLAISRLQTSRQGSILVVIDEADPRLLFSWLTEVQSLTGVKPVSAQVFSRGGGQVRATIEFPTGGAG